MKIFKIFAGILTLIGLLTSAAFIQSMPQTFQYVKLLSRYNREVISYSSLGEIEEEAITGSHFRYSSLIGGSSHDHAHIMGLDSKGNPIIAGYTYSKDFPVTYHLGSSKVKWCNLFVIKFNRQNHQVIFSTLIGGSYIDRPTAIYVDENDQIYLTGYTRSVDFPVSRNALQTKLNGEKDGFLLKLNAIGSALLYSTYIGGLLEDVPNALAVDPKGNAYIAGTTNSPDFPVTGGAFQRFLNGEKDIFFAKINHNGTHLLHSTYIGGSSDDKAEAMVYCKEKELIYIAGSTLSINFPHLRRLRGDQNPDSSAIFVLKILPNAYEIVPCFFTGGSSKDDVVSLALDSQSNLWVGGNTHSVDFPVQRHIVASSSQYPGIFLLQWNDEKQKIEKSLSLSGNDKDFLRTMTFKEDDSLLLGGLTYSSNLLAREDAVQDTNQGNGDGFIIRLDITHEIILFASFLGGSSFDEIRSMHADVNNDIWITGNTLSEDFPLTQDAQKKTISLAQCTFLVRLSVVSVFQPPVLSLPEKDSADIVIDPIFHWHSDEIGGTYQFFLYDQNYRRIYQSEHLHQLFFELPFFLEYENRYYWMVQLIHPSGITKASPVWMFRTDSQQIQLSFVVYSLKSSYSSSEAAYIKICLINTGNTSISDIKVKVQHPESFQIIDTIPFYPLEHQLEQTILALPDLPYRKVLSFQARGVYSASVDEPVTIILEIVVSYMRHQSSETVEITIYP